LRHVQDASASGSDLLKSLLMTSAANISVHIPVPLRDCCGGSSELRLAAASVRDVLAAFEHGHPALYRSICDDTGSVRRHVNLFVNTNHMRDCHGIDTLLAAGDVVTILPAVSGG
jgi:sulfur-carrier protein